jgi:hypothetical protein
MAFRESQHPRDRRGRFARKGSGLTAIAGSSAKSEGFKLPGTAKVTVRASLSSATVTYGRTLPLIPGRVNVHLGVLARVEKAGGGPNFLEKRADRLIDAVASRLPQNKAGSAVADVLRGKKTEVAGVAIGGNRRRINPTLRATSKSKKATAGRKVRKPRQPRQPRQRRTS